MLRPFLLILCFSHWQLASAVGTRQLPPDTTTVVSYWLTTGEALALTPREANLYLSESTDVTRRALGRPLTGYERRSLREMRRRLRRSMARGEAPTLLPNTRRLGYRQGLIVGLLSLLVLPAVLYLIARSRPASPLGLTVGFVTGLSIILTLFGAGLVALANYP